MRRLAPANSGKGRRIVASHQYRLSALAASESADCRCGRVSFHANQDIMGSSLARMLSTVDIFSEDASVWTVGAIAARLGYTRATAYRYVGELCDAGLLTRLAQGAYALGPRIIELDRQIRHCDPFLRAGERVMEGLLRPNRGQVVLLCSLFRDQVLCTHQASRDTELALSYTRGRPMPLFRGATSKVILACLPERRLTRLFVENQAEIRKAGLGRTRQEFLAALKAIRRQGWSITHAEIDPGVIGIAVPVFDGERSVIGSLSIVFPEDRFPERQADKLASELKGAAESIRVELGKLAEAPRQGKGRPRKERPS